MRVVGADRAGTTPFPSVMHPQRRVEPTRAPAGGWLIRCRLLGRRHLLGKEVNLYVYQSADNRLSEFQVAIALERSSRATSIPPIAGTPFEPATKQAASSETGTCHPSSPAFTQTGQIEYREVGLA